MAISVTHLIRLRKEWLRKQQPAVREILTAAKKLQRELTRVNARKKTFPEEADLVRMLNLLNKVFKEGTDVSNELAKGYPQ